MSEPNATHLPLGEYFTLEELSKSKRGEAAGIINMALDPQLVNLTRLVTILLDPLREEVGRLDVTSGFRNEQVNKLVGGVPNSYHRKGLAADMQHATLTPRQLCEAVWEMNLPFRKCIDEDDGDKQWLHLSLPAIDEEPLKRFLTMRIVDGHRRYTPLKV